MDMIPIYIENTLLCLLSRRQRTIRDCIYFGTKGNYKFCDTGYGIERFHKFVMCERLNGIVAKCTTMVEIALIN